MQLLSPGQHEKMISNIQEIKARGGIVIAIATEKDKNLAKEKYLIELLGIHPLLFLVVCP